MIPSAAYWLVESGKHTLLHGRCALAIVVRVFEGRWQVHAGGVRLPDANGWEEGQWAAERALRGLPAGRSAA